MGLLSYLRRYPALAGSVVTAALPLAAHWLPADLVSQGGEFALAALALAVGAEVHRRVTPVPDDDRGIKPTREDSA